MARKCLRGLSGLAGTLVDSWLQSLSLAGLKAFVLVPLTHKRNLNIACDVRELVLAVSTRRLLVRFKSLQKYALDTYLSSAPLHFYRFCVRLGTGKTPCRKISSLIFLYSIKKTCFIYQCCQRECQYSWGLWHFMLPRINCDAVYHSQKMYFVLFCDRINEKQLHWVWKDNQINSWWRL